MSESLASAAARAAGLAEAARNRAVGSGAPDAVVGIGAPASGSPDASRPGLGTRILDRMERQGRTFEQLGRAMLPENAAERMRNTLSEIKEGGGRFASGLLSAVNPRTEGGRTFWYSTLTAATVAGLRQVGMEMAGTDASYLTTALIGAGTGILKEGITEGLKSKDWKKTTGAVLAGAVIGATASVWGRASNGMVSDEMAVEAFKVIGTGALASFSNFVKESGKTLISGERGNVLSGKTIKEAIISGIMAGTLTGLADYFFPKTQGLDLRVTESSTADSSSAVEGGTPVTPVAVVPTGETATSTPTPTATATETATNTPTPTRTPEVVIAAPAETPAGTATALPIPTQESITGIHSATPTGTPIATAEASASIVTPTPTETSTPVSATTSAATATSATVNPGIGGLPGPGSVPADVPGTGELRPWSTATATATPESAAKGAGSTWESIKEWLGNLGRGAPSHDEYGNPVVRPTITAPGDNIDGNDNGVPSGAQRVTPVPLSGEPGPDQVEPIRPTLGPGLPPEVSSQPPSADLPPSAYIPGGSDAFANESAGQAPVSPAVSAPQPDAVQDIPGGSDTVANETAGQVPVAEAPGSVAQPVAEAQATDAAANNIEQAVKGFDKEIPLPKGSTPWAVAEQLLKQANPDGEFTPADIMAVDKALILAQVDPNTGEQIIAVPEWGIEGKILASKLPPGMKFQITDEVRQAVLAAAKK